MNSSRITFRSEQLGDEDAIDLVIYRAFGRAGEAHLVRALRDTYSEFDPRFSITAWDGDEIVGHTLFTPARIRLMGKTVDALLTAPVAVLPERQRQGIGSRMLQVGHDLGVREGYAFVFLAGHPEYYTWFGYKACFGFSKITIDTDKLPEPSQTLGTWPVQRDDVPWLRECLERELVDVDFGWLWGGALEEWALSGINSLIWRAEDGRRAAYTLQAPSGTWQCVLSDDPALARDVIATVKPATLEHHPAGWLAREVVDPAWGEAKVEAHPAAMACELQDGALGAYMQAVDSGVRPPGACNWSLPFMLCL